jgi:hypothetical protein
MGVVGTGRTPLGLGLSRPSSIDRALPQSPRNLLMVHDVVASSVTALKRCLRMYIYGPHKVSQPRSSSAGLLLLPSICKLCRLARWLRVPL